MKELKNSKTESLSTSSFKSAFWLGVKNGLVGPAPVLVAGMMGFGAMSHGVGLDPFFATFISLSVFALPGQVVFVEMVSVGASASAIAFAVAITSARFLTMTLTLFPQIPKELKEPPRLLTVHLVAMSAWTYCMLEFPKLKNELRYGYFVGIGTICLLISLPATLIGYWLSDAVPIWVTYALLFVNPLFFLMSFTEVPIRSNQLAIVFGGVSSIYFFQYYPSNALLISGVGVGSLIYLIDFFFRKFSRSKN
jgi:predicted branched-subunit amino acid permease